MNGSAVRHDDLTIDTIRDALFSIDPNMSRGEWARVGMALKAELGEAGFGLFDDWSRTGDNYSQVNSRDTWKSIKPAGGVGVATLIWKAQQNGFRLDDNRPTLPVEQIEKRRAERAAERVAAEAELRQLQGEAARIANEVWDAARVAVGDDHAYLQSKGVQAHSLCVGEWPLFKKDSAEIWRREPGALLIPIMDAKNGKLISLQGIYHDQEGEISKRYLKNGRKRGGFHMIGTPPLAGAPLVFVEGYATGATIHEITGWCVIVTFDAPNLPVVAEIMREKFAQAAFIIAADNDAWTKAGDIDNPGVHFGKRAADATRGCMIVPQFADVSQRPTDFNDLAMLEGADIARAQLMANPVADTAAGDAGTSLLPANDNVDYFTPLPDVGGKGKPLATIENLAEVIDRLGVTIRYNVISKSEEILNPRETHLIDNRARAGLARLSSECARFGMADGKLGEFVNYLADKNPFNPVATWINSKPWDGQPRLQALLDTVTPVDDRRLADGRSLKEVLMRRWMMSAIAGAFSPEGVSAHGILVFQGPQYLGKTMWFKQLVPAELGVLKDGLLLNPADRDSVRKAVSFWLVELGELDATFRKSDVAALKSFVTESQDVMRLSYAKSESYFARRTVFFGSVNPREFLHDVTGNRRYWTVECAAIDLEGQRKLDMQQVWAEAYALWQGGECHFLTGIEMDALNANNQEFQAVDPIEERLGSRLDWSSLPTSWTWRTATDVLISIGIDRPTTGDATRAAMLLGKMNGGQRKRNGGARFLLCPPPVRDSRDGFADDRPF